MKPKLNPKRLSAGFGSVKEFLSVSAIALTLSGIVTAALMYCQNPAHATKTAPAKPLAQSLGTNSQPVAGGKQWFDRNKYTEYMLNHNDFNSRLGGGGGTGANATAVYGSTQNGKTGPERAAAEAFGSPN